MPIIWRLVCLAQGEEDKIEIVNDSGVEPARFIITRAEPESRHGQDFGDSYHTGFLSQAVEDAYTVIARDIERSVRKAALAI